MDDQELIETAGYVGVPVGDDWSRGRIITALVSAAVELERGQ